jgi:hypothetical protein
MMFDKVEELDMMEKAHNAATDFGSLVSYSIALFLLVGFVYSIYLIFGDGQDHPSSIEDKEDRT